MNRYLITLEARTPGDMDPEVRADLFQRTREALPQGFFRMVGQRTVTGIVAMGSPHEFIAELPLFPWLHVTVMPLCDF